MNELTFEIESLEERIAPSLCVAWEVEVEAQVGCSEVSFETEGELSIGKC
jgi:hypothetical protein